MDINIFLLYAKLKNDLPQYHFIFKKFFQRLVLDKKFEFSDFQQIAETTFFKYLACDVVFNYFEAQSIHLFYSQNLEELEPYKNFMDVDTVSSDYIYTLQKSKDPSVVNLRIYKIS